MINPPALRILSHLAETDITTKPDLDKVCAVGESARTKALKNLRSIGLIAVDDFRSPAEVILARKAFQTRPEPRLARSLDSRTKIKSTLAVFRR